MTTDALSISVTAYGLSDADAYPDLTLIVDGTPIGSQYVSGTSSAYNFSANLALGVGHTIQVGFYNTYGARLLQLQSLTINGVVIPATSPTESYVSRVGTVVGSGNLQYGGVATFDVPASVFTASGSPVVATPTPAPTPVTVPPTIPVPVSAPTPTPAPVVSAAPTPAASGTIGVTAYGIADSGLPSFSLIVDGAIVGQQTVTATSTSYAFAESLSTNITHRIQVAFYNTNGARALELQSISVNGTVYSATDPSEIYVSRVGTVTGVGDLQYGGIATFQIPAGTTTTTVPPVTVTPTPVTPVTVTPAPVVTPTAPNTPASGFYVATTGNDGGDGSLAHPFATMARAQAAMEASSIHTTYVEGGTYTPSSTLTLTGADSGFSFTAYAGRQAIISGGNNLQTLVDVNGSSNVTLSGLTFENTAVGSAAVLLDGASNNKVFGNTFLQSGSSAIEAKNGSNGNTISDNTINGAGAAETVGAIYLHGANNNLITHNLVENTQGAGISLSDFYTTSTATQNIGNTVSYNSLQQTDLSSTDSGAIYVLGRSDANTMTSISMNFVNGTGSATQHSIGIYLDDNANGVNVTNNIVTGIGSDGFQIHGGSNDSFTNNIFDLGTGSAAAGLFQSPPSNEPNPSPSQNDSVTGNIFVTESASPATPLFVNLNGGQPTVSGNDYWSFTGSRLNAAPDTAASYENPGFAGGSYATSGDGIGFHPINQSAIGLLPSTS